MKNNISIIFSVIIGTLLLVLLPLYSLMDRQDSMAYNVVLTETTKFVDNIRNNGFIDQKSYEDYLLAINSTSNTYKVTIEAYRKKLIHDVNGNGSINNDTFVEDIELYNTQDILDAINSNSANDKSNIKNGVFLLEEQDEVYVRVYNTNRTVGSTIYNLIAGVTDSKVIDISYGGAVNDINWDMYTKVKEGALEPPEVILSVPVNANGETNVVKSINADNKIEYSYVYTLADAKNQTINISLRFNGADKINVNGTYVPVSTLTNLSAAEQAYIIKNYIQLNGIKADVNIAVNKSNNNLLSIRLTNVEQSSLDGLATLGSITILPGLGKDENDIDTLGAETVELELVREMVESEIKVKFTGPYNFNELKEGKTSGFNVLSNIFVKQEVFFILETDLMDIAESEQKRAVEDSVNTLEDIFNYTVYTTEELEKEIGVDVSTESSNKTIIKVVYNSEAASQRLQLNNFELDMYAYSILSSETMYDVLNDTYAPEFGDFTEYQIVGGQHEQRAGDWYNGAVYVGVDNTNEKDYASSAKDKEGSGIYKYTIQIDSSTEQTIANNQEIKIEPIDTQTVYTVTYRAYDNAGNIRKTTKQIKIDITNPTLPSFEYKGTKGYESWFTSNAVVTITPGVDYQSKVAKTTYKILTEGGETYKEGTITNNVATAITLTESGKFTVVANTIDNAGNVATNESAEIKIDNKKPEAPEIKLTGDLNESKTEYIDRVNVNITSKSTTPSGYEKTTYSLRDVTKNTYIEQDAFLDYVKEIDVLPDGNYEVLATVYNVAGTTSNQTKKAFVIKTPVPKEPVVEITGTTHSNNWYVSDVNVKLSKADGDEKIVKSIKYKVEKYEMNSYREYISETEGTNFILIESGIYKVTVKAINRNGVETSKVVEIKLDKTKLQDPQIEIIGEKNNSGNYILKADVNIKIVDDTVSKYSKTKYTIYKGSEIVQNGEFTETEKTLTLAEDGNYTIKLELYTNAQSVTEYIEQVVIETPIPQAPTITDESMDENSPINSAKWYKTGVKVNINGQLEDKDITNKITYMIEKYGQDELFVEETEGNEIILNKTGIYTVIARAYNRNGRYTESEKVINIELEAPEKPVIEITGTQDSSDRYIDGAKINISIKNNSLSGAKSAKVIVVSSVENTETELNIAGEKKVEHTLEFTQDGTYTIVAEVETTAGNISGETVTIELKQPEITVKAVVEPEPNEHGWYGIDQGRVVISNETQTEDESIIVKKVCIVETKHGDEYINREELPRDMYVLNKSGTYRITVRTYYTEEKYIEDTVEVKLDVDELERPNLDVQRIPDENGNTEKVIVESLIINNSYSGLSKATLRIVSDTLEEQEIDIEITEDKRIWHTLELTEPGTYIITLDIENWAGNTVGVSDRITIEEVQ